MAGKAERARSGSHGKGQVRGDEESGEKARRAMVADGAGHGADEIAQGMIGTAAPGGYVFREPVRMQVLIPGHDPVEVRAYATIDARLQAASLLDVDIAVALEAKVAVETKALHRWQKDMARGR